MLTARVYFLQKFNARRLNTADTKNPRAVTVVPAAVFATAAVVQASVVSAVQVFSRTLPASLARY